MAEITDEYAARLTQALRRNASDTITAEVKGLAAECRADMERLGILPAKAEDETDDLVYGAVRDFCKWRFGLGNPDADRYMQMYQCRVDELRSSEGYYVDDTEVVS